MRNRQQICNAKSRPGIILFLLFVLTVATLPGQDFFAERDQILDNHWKRLGPIYLTPRLLIRNLGYNDNIYRFSELSTSDWTVDLGLELRSDLLLGRRLILSYEFLPQYHFYAEQNQLSNWTFGHRLRLHSYLGPFNIRVNGHSDQHWAAPNPEYGLSVRYKSRGADARISLGNPRHFNLSVLAVQMNNEYEDLRYLGQYDLSRFNYQLESIGLELGLRVFTSTRLALSYTRQQLRYQTLGELDAQIDQLGLSLQLPQLGSLRGSLSAGMQRFSPKDDRYSRLETPYGSGSVVLQPGKRWRLLLGYQIRVQDSFNQIEQLFVQGSWNAGLDLYLSKRWRLGYRFIDNLLQYRLRSQAQTVLGRDRYQLHGAQLAFRFSEGLAIGLSWNRSRTVQSSVQRRRDYSFIGGYLESDF